MSSLPNSTNSNGISRVNYTGFSGAPPLNVQVDNEAQLSEIANQTIHQTETKAPELKITLTPPIFQIMTKVMENLVSRLSTPRSKTQNGATKFETIKKEAEGKGFSIKPIDHTKIQPGNVLLVERDNGKYYEVCEASQRKSYPVYTHARLGDAIENPLKLHQVDESIKLHKGHTVGKEIDRQNMGPVDPDTRYWLIEDKQTPRQPISIFDRIANFFNRK